MCGIVGFISKKYDRSMLVEMTDAIIHRGPDADGYFFDADSGIGLGHRRLSVLDLSSSANQPMNSHCGRYKIVYNGEVYNFKEISRSLDLDMNTTTDTEVILEAFVQFGVDFIKKLNGMFSIAIYDNETNQLYLFRDRIGIKPLYYYFQNHDLVFASEMKAILTLDIKLSLNKSAVSNYLHFGYSPKEETIYSEINKLPAGSYAIYKNGDLQINTYWNIYQQINPNATKDITKAKSELKNLLYDSIEKRLISDVPIGTFLSGGTDSSLVTSIASKVSSTPINTFSIGFKEAKFNESEKAKEIAKHLKTNHHEFIVSDQDVLEELNKVLDNFDEPFADSSCFPTYIVSKLARKHVTVCLSGDGGDELFMGYGSYNWAHRLSNPLIWSLRKPISKALKSSGKNRSRRASLVFDSPTKNRMSHVFSQEQYLFAQKEINTLLVNPIEVCLDEKIDSVRNLSAKESQSFFDIKNYLKDDLLVKVDRASMLASLEVRVPLLDHRIVEFALNLDEKLKISQTGVSKFLLKEILHDHTPKELLDHPKWGFSIPMVKWLKNELKYLIDFYLNDDVIDEFKLFNISEVRLLKSRFLNGEDFLYNRIWQLIVINKFLLQNPAKLSF